MTDDKARVVQDILGDWGWADNEWDVEEEQDEHVYIIGLDPGGTTGLAILSIDPNDSKALPELIYLDQIPGGRDGFYDYFSDFYIGSNAVVASEIWVERNRKGVNREPQYIEGVIHALWNRHMVTWQEPDQKARVSDEYLQENNLWTPGMPHQMDGLRHAIIYLLDQEHAGTVSSVGGQGDGEPMAQPGEAESAQGDGQPMDEDTRRALADLAREAAEKRIAANEANGNGTVEPEGKRKERELDGAFMGFESEEAMSGDNEVSLLDD